MIIAGNSNVSSFRQQGIIASTCSEQISVAWVGALKVEHFFNGHPAGAKIRELFATSLEWKFLSIGIHDIHVLCSSVALGRYDQILEVIENLYFKLFRELSAAGKFGWLVFPQAAHEISFRGLTKEDVLRIAKTFNKKVETWCRNEGIIVVNPLHKILGSDDLPLSHLLQKDNTFYFFTFANFFLIKLQNY